MTLALPTAFGLVVVWAVAAALLVVFVATPWPRDKLGLVDWPLLVLFLGIFVVNGALAETGGCFGDVPRSKSRNQRPQSNLD